MSSTPAQNRRLATSRRLEHVVVLGANGTMGYGAAALFTQAIPRVTLLARSRDKAQEGLAAATRQVRSQTVANHADVGSYEDLDASLATADLVFEALTEDFALKKQMFDRVEKARRPDSIVATVTSGLSINELADGRSDSFRRHFLGLHLFNPPNVIVGTELIPGRDTDPALVDFIEAFSRVRLGREIVRTHDAPAFAGNRVGFKVLNEVAQLAEQMGPRARGSAGRPVHRPRHDAARDHRPRRLGHPPRDRRQRLREHEGRGARDAEAPRLHGEGHGAGRARQQVGRGLLQARGQDLARPRSEDAATTARSPSSRSRSSTTSAGGRAPRGGSLRGGPAGLPGGRRSEAEIARRVIAGYVSYAFQRVGEVTDTITGIDRIMATGFNWAPPSVLVDIDGRARRRSS